jgi:thymidine kinase
MQSEIMSNTVSIGSCEIVVGCMCSGKSSNLISKLTQAADLQFKVAYCNHSKDIRITESSDSVVNTHNSGFQKLSSKIKGFKMETLNPEDLNDFDVIGIDEYQFFEKQNQNVKDLVLKYGKRVIIASLDYNFKLEPMGEVHELYGLCGPGDVNKLYAICKLCDRKSMKKAGWTLKISGDNSVVDVGGMEKYIPVCLECHVKHNTYK